MGLRKDFSIMEIVWLFGININEFFIVVINFLYINSIFYFVGEKVMCIVIGLFYGNMCFIDVGKGLRKFKFFFYFFKKLVYFFFSVW